MQHWYLVAEIRNLLSRLMRMVNHFNSDTSLKKSSEPIHFRPIADFKIALNVAARLSLYQMLATGWMLTSAHFSWLDRIEDMHDLPVKKSSRDERHTKKL